MEAKKVLLTGATGMVGGLALRNCLSRREIDEITAIGRRPTEARNPKLTEVVHWDFNDFREVAGAFDDCDVALFCLGAYTGSVADKEFREITGDHSSPVLENREIRTLASETRE